MPGHSGEDKPVASNKKARFNYEVTETVEAGIVLLGSEVKSLRAGQVSLSEAFARVERGEVFLYNFDIAVFALAGPSGEHPPKRPRKLLLHRTQIRKLIGATAEKGLTLIPLKVYFNARGLAKILLGLARGKRSYDKRETIRKRDAQRDMKRAYARSRRNTE